MVDIGVSSITFILHGKVEGRFTMTNRHDDGRQEPEN
jgi:hypothetical protein